MVRGSVFDKYLRLVRSGWLNIYILRVTLTDATKNVQKPLSLLHHQEEVFGLMIGLALVRGV